MEQEVFLWLQRAHNAELDLYWFVENKQRGIETLGIKQYLAQLWITIFRAEKLLREVPSE